MRRPWDGPLIEADAGQLQQVVLNLCTNAIQAMSEKGGVLTVALEAVGVDAAFADLHPPLQPGPHVRLAVQDTGVGMDGATLARLFEPFFTTRPPGVGTGIGLAVVQGIVKGCQGAIDVASQPGAGTTFALYFRACEPASEEGRPAVPGKGEHLLLVDDESYLVEMGKALLTRLGYRVSGFTDPERALDVFTAQPDAFAALITDLTMPALKGTDLAQRLRALRPGLPVILATGFTGPHELDRARAMGFDRVLEKPYTVDRFVDVLTKALAGPAAPTPQ